MPLPHFLLLVAVVILAAGATLVLALFFWIFVEAISRISTVIAEINDFQATIAAAVEEQTATTNEMNRNVAEAANGTQGIAAAISGLAAGTQETNQRVDDAQAAAADLARMSGELQEAVARFTV